MKRIFWGTLGYTAGLSTSIWVQRRVRRAVETYTPERVRHDLAERGRQVADRTRDVVVDLREAVGEGLAEMRTREAALRAEFAPGVDPHRPRPARLRH